MTLSPSQCQPLRTRLPYLGIKAGAPLGDAIPVVFFWKVVICYRCRSVSHSQAGSWSTVYGVGMYAVRCYTRLPAFLSQGSAEHDVADTSASSDEPVEERGHGTNRGSLGGVGTRIPRRTYAPP